MHTLFTPLWEHVASLVRSARERVIVVSPWIGAGIMPELLSLSGAPASRWTVLSVGLLADFAAGASDLRAFEQLVAEGADVRVARGLHAKIYVADGARALYGSANLTRSGLRHNLEVAALTSDAAEVAALADRALTWHAAALPVSADWIEQMRGRLAQLGAATPESAQAPELEGPDLSAQVNDAPAVPAPPAPAGTVPIGTAPPKAPVPQPGEDPYTHLPLPSAWRAVLAPLLPAEITAPAHDVPPDLQHRIDLSLAGLTPHQRTVLDLRQAQDLTLEQAGERMEVKVTRERIRQIAKAALKRFELAARARPAELVEVVEGCLRLAERPAIRLVRLPRGAAPTVRQACALWAHARERRLELVDQGDFALVYDRDDVDALEARLAHLFVDPRFYGPSELAEAIGVREDVLEALTLVPKTRLQRLAMAFGWRWSMREQMLAVARHLADAGHVEWHISEMARALELVNPADFGAYHPRNVDALVLQSEGQYHHSGIKGTWHLREHGDGHRTTPEALEAILRDAPCPLHLGGIMAALRRNASAPAVTAALRTQPQFRALGNSVFGLRDRDEKTTDGYRETEAWLHAAVVAEGGVLALPKGRARAESAGIRPDWLIGAATLSPRLDYFSPGHRSAGGFRLKFASQLQAGDRAAHGEMQTAAQTVRVRPSETVSNGKQPIVDFEVEKKPGLEPVWTPIDPGTLHHPFWSALVSAARDTADREGLALDTSDFAPCAAAIRHVEWRALEVVVTARHWRGVGAVRFGGAPALLVGELDTIDNDRINDGDLELGVRVSLVRDAGAPDATRVAVGDSTGWRL